MATPKLSTSHVPPQRNEFLFASFVTCRGGTQVYCQCFATHLWSNDVISANFGRINYVIGRWVLIEIIAGDLGTLWVVRGGSGCKH